METCNTDKEPAFEAPFSRRPVRAISIYMQRLSPHMCVILQVYRYTYLSTAGASPVARSGRRNERKRLFREPEQRDDPSLSALSPRRILPLSRFNGIRSRIQASAERWCGGWREGEEEPVRPVARRKSELVKSLGGHAEHANLANGPDTRRLHHPLSFPRAKRRGSGSRRPRGRGWRIYARSAAAPPFERGKRAPRDIPPRRSSPRYTKRAYCT